MLDKLKDRRGEFLLEGAVKLLFLCAGIALVISVFSVAFQANKLHVIAKDIVRMTEIQGQYDAAAVAQEFQRLKTTENLESAVMDLDAAYIAGASRVVSIVNDAGMFGYHGIARLMRSLREEAAHPQDLKKLIDDYGVVI